MHPGMTGALWSFSRTSSTIFRRCVCLNLRNGYEAQRPIDRAITTVSYGGFVRYMYPHGLTTWKDCRAHWTDSVVSTLAQMSRLTFFTSLQTARSLCVPIQGRRRLRLPEYMQASCRQPWSQRLVDIGHQSRSNACTQAGERRGP